MSAPMSIVATNPTRLLARAILSETEEDGADAVMRHLPDVQPCQVPALIALIAKAAVTGEVPARPSGQPAKPLLLTEDERRKAHARFRQGARDRETMRGEREYQRESKQRNRRIA